MRTALLSGAPSLLATCALVCLAQTRPPSPGKVIEDYLRAAGGSKAIAQIRTETLAGNLTEESTGIAGSWSLVAKAPDRLYSEIIAGPDRVVEAYNGKSSWGQDSAEGIRTLTGEAASKAENTAREWNERLADVKKSRLGLQLLGAEKLHGHDAWHMQVTHGPGTMCDLYFDASTHLILRETLPGEQFDYDDYRPVGGIQTPFHIELHRDNREYKIALTRAEFNAPVEDSVFDFPHTTAAPLTDIATLIHEVTRNQNAIDELQKQYTCHVTEEQDNVDSKGRIASRTVREYEVFNIGGEEVRHLLAKDGKPLEGSDRKKEDDRFNKEFAKQTKRAADKANDPPKQAREEAKDDAQLSDFLRAVRFTNARRELFRGQQVIAVDFGPNPDYKPRKAIENVIHQMEGVIWIDEQALDVALLEAHFSSKVKIGGGVVASLDKGSGFVFEQARVNNEVWLPTYDEVHLGGRFLLLKLRANQIDRYTDYKKFHADSTFVPEQD